MPASKPQMVFEELKNRIKAGELLSGSALPSISKLCAAFEVSKASVLGALKLLEKEGLVLRRQRSGVFVKGIKGQASGAKARELPPAGDRSEQVARAIKKDIGDAKFRVGEFFPSSKQLQFHYHASSQTVRSALTILEQSELIHRRGHAFLVGPESMPNPSTRERFLLAGERIAVEGLQQNSGTTGFLGSFEVTAREFGIQIDQKVTYGVNPDYMFPPEPAFENVRGVLFAPGVQLFKLVQGELFEPFQKQALRILKKPLPMVIFCGLPPSPRFLKAFQRFRNVFFMSFGGPISGETVGRYLATMGHRKASYFSFSTEIWNRWRWEGFRRAHQRTLGRMSEIALHDAGFDKSSLFGEAIMKEPMEMFRRLTGDLAPHCASAPRMEPDQDLARRLVEIMVLDRHYPVMRNFFEKSLKDDSSSVWVCADPMVARVARDFLVEKGIRVPEDISLISIGDTPEMLIQRISAYSVLPQRVGYLAAHCLIGDIPIRKKPNGSVDCAGRIIERGSVGKV